MIGQTIPQSQKREAERHRAETEANRHLIRETYDNDTKRTERQAVMDLVEPDLLILDEVGLQKNSDWEHEKLYEIINGRYEREKPMIVMSNEDIDGLRAFLGERCVDRLREKGKALAFDWQSYRANGGAA